MDLTMMERVGERWKEMEGYCSIGQSPQQAAVPVEDEGRGEEEEEEEEEGGGGGGGEEEEETWKNVLYCGHELT
jgi:hypothetical protein